MFFFVLFQRLFAADQMILDHISKFKNMDNVSLLKSQVLQSHATVVMQAIDSTISGIDNAEKTHHKLRKLGVEHKVRNIRPELIAEIREPFLSAVEQTLGDRYTDHMRHIYEAFIDYLLKEIKDGYNS